MSWARDVTTPRDRRRCRVSSKRMICMRQCGKSTVLTRNEAYLRDATPQLKNKRACQNYCLTRGIALMIDSSFHAHYLKNPPRVVRSRSQRLDRIGRDGWRWSLRNNSDFSVSHLYRRTISWRTENWSPIKVPASEDCVHRTRTFA